MATNWVDVPTPKIWQSWMGGDYTTITGSTAWNTTMTTSAVQDRTWGTWEAWTTTTTTEFTVPGSTFRYDPKYTWERWDANQQQYILATREDEVAIQRRLEATAEIRRLAEERLAQERDALQRANEERAARRLALQPRLEGARERAMELFRSLLTPEQLATLDDPDIRSVIVMGSGGGLYEIEVDGRLHGNINSIDEHGCKLGRLCVAPQMYDSDMGIAMPNGDGYAGQLLAIRFNEPMLLAKANWSHQRTCQVNPGVPLPPVHWQQVA